MIWHQVPFAISNILVLALSLGCGGSEHSGREPSTRMNPPAPAVAPDCNLPMGLPPPSVFNVIRLAVADGEETEARVWPPAQGSAPSDLGLLFVTGIDGGFIEPADDIYDRLAAHYSSLGAHSIFVQYRLPGQIEPSVADALTAAEWLRNHGVRRMAVLGWSFGGAVAIHSAVGVPEMRAVIGFSPQSLDTEPVLLFTTQSLLVFHSVQDENVPYSAVLGLMAEVPAGIRKELVSFQEGAHSLSGLSPEVSPKVLDWLGHDLPPDVRNPASEFCDAAKGWFSSRFFDPA
jgi:alpha/beta superfamily hydrolase